MNTCPTCGHHVENDVMVSLDTNVIVARGVRREVTPSAAVVLSVLRDRMPAFVHTEALRAAISGNRETADSLVSVTIYNTRREIRGLPARIENRCRLGYRLVLEAV